MILTQGATYLQMRTVGELHLRTRTVSTVAALVTLVCFALAGVWVYYGIDGYVVKSVMDHSGPSNPLTKEVVREAGAWMVNFNNMPALWAVPALGVVLPLLTVVSTKADKGAWAFLFSSLTLACIILTAGIAMFPFIMPSSTMLNASLTMWDATSSQRTLNLMTYVRLSSCRSFWPTPAGVTGRCSAALRAKTSKRTPTRCTKVRSYICGTSHGFWERFLPVPLG